MTGGAVGSYTLYVVIFKESLSFKLFHSLLFQDNPGKIFLYIRKPKLRKLFPADLCFYFNNFLGILTTPWTISLRLANKDSRNIILFPSDNDPPQGFKVRRGYVVSLSKTLNSKQTVTFRAIEDESRAKVLLNGKESIQVTAARGKPTPLDVILTGKILGSRKTIWETSAAACVGNACFMSGGYR